MKERKPRSSVKTNDREFILTTAASLFREHGYERTSVKQLAEACGMLTGSLHYRYNSKESILVDMMRLGVERITSELILSIDRNSPPRKQLKDGVDAHLRILISDSDLVYVLLFEWRSLRGDARLDMLKLRDSYEGLWAELLERLAREKSFRKGIDLELLRLIGLGALNWVAVWYKEGGKYSLEEVGDFIYQIIVDAVLSK